MISEIKNEAPIPKVQIIKRKIDANRMDDGAYFRRVKRSIRKELNKDANIVMIEFVPKNPIKEKWALDTWLHFQREFTDILIAPRSEFEIDKNEIENLTNNFNATLVMVGV